MSPALAPTVRSQFAKRLRSLRAQRGFERARHFAKSLGIEENRYTRYERAEVEPNLTLIYEMCEKLNTTPNELLGFQESGFAASGSMGFEEPSVTALADHAEPAAAKTGRIHLLAWQIAAEAAHLGSEPDSKTQSAADPLALMRDTARLYSRLEQDPFGTVAEIVDDPALRTVGTERKAKIAELIQAYTDALSE